MNGDNTRELDTVMPITINIQRPKQGQGQISINEVLVVASDVESDADFGIRNSDKGKEKSGPIGLSDMNIDLSLLEPSKRQCNPLGKLILIVMVLYLLVRVISRNGSI